MTHRWAAAVVSIGLVVAVLEPLVRSPYDDGFPLSTFPMFATPISGKVTMSFARGVTADGRRLALSPAHLGTGEVLQASSRIGGAVDAGPRASLALCMAIVPRVAGDAALLDVVAIELVTGTYNAVEAYAHGAGGHEVTRARCDVPRSTP
jgi:hypothetical protein